MDVRKLLEEVKSGNMEIGQAEELLDVYKRQIQG